MSQRSHKDYEVKRADGTVLRPRARGPRGPLNLPNGGKRWWTMEPADAAKAVSDNLSFYARNQRWRLQQLDRLSRWYDNQQALTVAGGELGLVSQLQDRWGDRLTLNVSASVVDTVVSKIARNKPRPYFLTNSGDYRDQRLAKDRNDWLSGLFYAQNTYAKTRLALRDACVWGPGIVRTRMRDGAVAHERVLPHQVFFDLLEAESGDGPRQLHLISFIDRETLLARYPKKEEAILSDSWREAGAYAWDKSLADLVCVRESWRLPSYKGAGDGLYLISANDAELEDPCEWTRPGFPIAMMEYSPRMRGRWPRGLVELGQAIQREIDRTAWSIQQSIEIVGTTKLYLPSGSAISVDQITNDFSAIIEGTQPPQWITPPIVQPEIYAYLDGLVTKYYNLAGISQADASSTKPSGDMSGEAIRLVHDIGTERFMALGQLYEEFHEEIARQSIQTATEAVERAKRYPDDTLNLEQAVHRRASARKVAFADLGFEPGEEIAVQCFPISLLPSDPAGRTELVQEYMQDGRLDPDVGADLMDFPDLGHVEALKNAPRDFVTATLEAVINDGTDYTIEDGLDDAALFLELGRQYYQRFKLPGAKVPGKRLVILQGIIRQASAIVAKNSALPQAPPGAPQAVPAPPPVSPLLPNAPAAKAA